MRRVVMMSLFLTLGVMMTETMEAADPPKKVELKAPFNEEVTVRIYLGQTDGEFLQRPVEGVHAYRQEVKGETQIRLKAGTSADGGFRPLGTSTLRPKSEIADKDGAVWVVTKFTGPHERKGGYHEYVATVTKKPAPKK